jgi:hypothetical protein
MCDNLGSWSAALIRVEFTFGVPMGCGEESWRTGDYRCGDKFQSRDQIIPSFLGLQRNWNWVL